MNSGCANAVTGPRGLLDAERTAEILALLAGNLAHSARNPSDREARTNCLVGTWLSIFALNLAIGLGQRFVRLVEVGPAEPEAQLHHEHQRVGACLVAEALAAAPGGGVGADEQRHGQRDLHAHQRRSQTIPAAAERTSALARALFR